MPQELHTPATLETMRRSCRLAAETLCAVGRILRPGMTTEEIDRFVHEYITSRGAHPSPLGYRGFPRSVCTSVNEVVCHGIPGKRVLREGDIINVDVTTQWPAKHGYHGDTSATFYIGEPSDEARHVTEVARRCLELALQVVRHNVRINEIGAVIEEYAQSEGCSVVREYVGHGVGRLFHMDPQIPHYKQNEVRERLRAGLTFTIEPMINLGGWQTELAPDGWTVLTKDRSLSAQFEHTVLVTRDGCEVLTKRDELLVGSEDRPWSRVWPLSGPTTLGPAVHVYREPTALTGR
ncbi:MAG: type I methionyl aminopeptidase [Myxococcota bacterium]|nr:type I methionyl aminopeptidase [Myxococcota bacterium]MDW8361193.1 type I methionyl aminopeptidase [Myxococcales bacterium]